MKKPTARIWSCGDDCGCTQAVVELPRRFRRPLRVWSGPLHKNQEPGAAEDLAAYLASEKVSVEPLRGRGSA